MGTVFPVTWAEAVPLDALDGAVTVKVATEVSSINS